jgi:hypothetical protein
VVVSQKVIASLSIEKHLREFGGGGGGAVRSQNPPPIQQIKHNNSSRARDPVMTYILGAFVALARANFTILLSDRSGKTRGTGNTT